MNLLAMIAANVFTALAVDAIKNSGSVIAEPVNQTTGSEPPTTIGNAIMSYELIGLDLDDDDIGAIGEDDGLYEALISGLGDTEIVGEDDLLIGARRSSTKARRAAALRKIAARNAAGVVRTGLDKRRRCPLGFLPTDITAAATQSIPSSPQNLFRPERLVIPSDIAFDLGITDIKVGNSSQFVQNVEVPAALFSEVAIETTVQFDTAEVGNQVSVAARNKSGVTVEFTAALVGTMAK